MSLPMRPSLLPQCTSCMRRISNLGLQEWRSGQQVRGKKKLANTPTTVTVRLLKDVPTFGRKGSFVPITIGQMRNVWFPKRTAEYVTDAQLKELKTKNVTAERDFQFGVTDEVMAKAAQSQAQRSPTKTIEVEKITPQRSMELLSSLVPSVMEIARPVKEAPAPAPEPPAPRSPPQRQRGPSNAAADLLAARSAPLQPAPSTQSTSSAGAIFGSVSTADVANRIKLHLSGDSEASRIVLTEKEINFVNVLVEGQATETDRVRHLGDYQVQILVKGAESPIDRLVRVSPLDNTAQSSPSGMFDYVPADNYAPAAAQRT